jgi:hypothetical protein
MKHFLLLLIIAVFSLSACHKSSGTGNIITASGILQKQGNTTYQYGTHILTDSQGNTTRVLKSKTINLDNYVGKQVIVTAQDVGPTPENGPKLYNVIGIFPG